MKTEEQISFMVQDLKEKMPVGVYNDDVEIHMDESLTMAQMGSQIFILEWVLDKD